MWSRRVYLFYDFAENLIRSGMIFTKKRDLIGYGFRQKRDLVGVPFRAVGGTPPYVPYVSRPPPSPRARTGAASMLVGIGRISTPYPHGHTLFNTCIRSEIIASYMGRSINILGCWGHKKHPGETCSVGRSKPCRVVLFISWPIRARGPTRGHAIANHLTKRAWWAKGFWPGAVW